MRYEDNVVTGFLGKYDLDFGLAIVNVTACLDVQATSHSCGGDDISSIYKGSCFRAWHFWQINGYWWDTDRPVILENLNIVESLCCPLVKSMRYTCIMI